MLYLEADDLAYKTVDNRSNSELKVIKVVSSEKNVVNMAQTWNTTKFLHFGKSDPTCQQQPYVIGCHSMIFPFIIFTITHLHIFGRT